MDTTKSLFKKIKQISHS